jgi:MFS family permease
MAWNFGLLAGFGLGGVIYEASHVAVFAVPAGAFVVIAGLLQIRLPEAAAARPENAPYQAPPVGRGFRKTAWLANFAVGSALGGAVTMFYDLAARRGIDPGINGVMLAVGRAAAMVAFIGLQVTGFWRVRLWPLWVAQLAGAVAILWIGAAESTWMFAVLFAVGGLASGYSYQASIFFSLEEIAEKGKGGGFHEAVVGLGMFAGPILAGVVGARSGLRAAFTACAAWLAVFVVAQMILVFVRRHESAKVPV